MINFVDAGIANHVVEVGGPWIQGDGFIEQNGQNKYLYADRNIKAGNFTLRATLSLTRLDGTAASFELANERFGFDSGIGNELFTEGVIWGSPQKYGPASNHISANQPFTFEVIRVGSDITFKINGAIIVTRSLTNDILQNVGFRPWRNTMRVYDFYQETELGGSTQIRLEDVNVFVNGRGYNNYRIPAIIRAGNGHLLAFAEGRTSHNDFGNIDIVMRRSTDDGETWIPAVEETPVVLADNGLLVSGNPGVVVDTHDNDKIVLVYNTGTNREPEIEQGNGVREVWVITSADNGYTWTPPINITTSVHRPRSPQFNPAYNFGEDWRWHAIHPGHAIQLNNGRLIFGANYKPMDQRPRAFVFYSDDHGNTWHIGGIAGEPGNENTLIQLANGDVMMNAREFRDSKAFTRYVSVSTNNGNTFSALQPDNELPDPHVEGSIIRLTKSPNRILFCNPAHKTQRRNLTVKLSYDDGNSWPISKAIQPSSSAYSDIVIQSNNLIGVLYENISSDPDCISYARFNLDWLTDGDDSLES